MPFVDQDCPKPHTKCGKEASRKQSDEASVWQGSLETDKRRTSPSQGPCIAVHAMALLNISQDSHISGIWCGGSQAFTLVRKAY